MSLRKKIILSNVITIIIPVVLILLIWTGYIYFGDVVSLKQVNRAEGREDLLTETMNILYTFEAELSDMNWDVVAFPGENGTDIIASPEKERIGELESLGYHVQVETADGIAFSNMDDTDRKILSKTGNGTEGAMFWTGDSLVIRDSFLLSGQEYYLTAVYDKDRSDRGMAASLLPVYMVSPAVFVIFLVIAVLCIISTSLIATRWISRSVLEPLDQLKKGADMIASGNLDYCISYERQDEFGDVCNEFDYMRLQLKEARQEQEQYEEERRKLLRGISHDLRSPLTSIKGYAHGLKDGIADTEEKRQRYCDAILTRANDLERLTHSLSHLVRLEDEKSMLKLEKVCLDEYIRQLLSEKNAWFAEQKVFVDYHTEDADAEVLIDIHEMQRVFVNLFENTVRYRIRERSQVELSVLIRGYEAEIHFTDDGPGVSQKHLKHLFDSFYRADESRTNPEKGSGLGLAVVKSIIEGENGRVYAVSGKKQDDQEHGDYETENRGLGIVMILPLSKEARNEENTDC